MRCHYKNMWLFSSFFQTKVLLPICQVPYIRFRSILVSGYHCLSCWLPFWSCCLPLSELLATPLWELLAITVWVAGYPCLSCWLLLQYLSWWLPLFGSWVDGYHCMSCWLPLSGLLAPTVLVAGYHCFSFWLPVLVAGYHCLSCWLPLS